MGLPVCLCRRLRRLGIKFRRAVLADGYDGWYDADTHTIVIDERLDEYRARSVLAHEIVHAERGDRHAGTAWGELSQERMVDTIAARMLLPIEAFADALVDAVDEFQVARELGVDMETVRHRLADLTQSEQDYIDVRVHGRMPAQRAS